MIDFGALPPEVNSGRLYAGAGSGSLMAAASAWDRLAGELSANAAAYEAKVRQLTDQTWRGPSSALMAEAAAPYVAWMNSAASQAEEAANQARSAAAAYESALASTVPVPVVETNRANCAVLTATNVFGQNTPAIASTEFRYSEMWAQDAIAMYSYAGASASASQLAPFTAPKKNTNEAGSASQGAAVANAASAPASHSASAVMSNITNALQSLTSGPGGFFNPGTWATDFEAFSAAIGTEQLLAFEPVFIGVGVLYLILPEATTGIGKAMAATAAAAAAAGASSVGSVSSAAAGALPASTLVGSSSVMAAGLGDAVPVGALSVPPSWATNVPAIRLASASLPLDAASGRAGAATGRLHGMSAIVSVVNTPRTRLVVNASGCSQVAVAGEANTAHLERGAVERRGEIDEDAEALEGLRLMAAELAMERDVLRLSASLLVDQQAEPVTTP